MDNETTVKDFFQGVSKGNYVGLDMIHRVENFTSHFNKDKVLQLESDLQHFEEEEERATQERKLRRDQLREVITKIKQSTVPNKLEQPQIALMHIYEKKIISKDNADAIALSYGHKSGNRLYNCYCAYCNVQDRTGGSEKEKKFKNNLQKIKSVIPLLVHNNEAQQWAMREAGEMEKKEKEYAQRK